MRNKISFFEKLSRIALMTMVVFVSSGTAYILRLPTARALTTITVNDTTDGFGNSDCTDGATIREAFGTGNGCVNDDTSPDTAYAISVQSGTYVTSIPVTSPADTSVTMTGQGAGSTTISSTSTNPFITTTAGSGALSISNITITAATEFQYVVGVETPMDGNLTIDHTVINAGNAIPLYIGANSTDGVDSLGGASITNSTFNGDNNGIYVGLMPGLFEISRAHDFASQFNITSNVFNIDNGTGGVGAPSAIAFLAASAPMDIETNDINMTGTNNIASGVFVGNFYDGVGALLLDPTVIAVNDISGSPDLGGGIKVENPSLGVGVTIGANTITGNISGTPIEVFNSDCLSVSCGNAESAAITSNVINVTASGGLDMISSGILVYTNTNTIAYNSVTLSDGAGGVIPETNGITCIAFYDQTCNVSGNDVSGFGQFGIAGILPTDSNTLTMNVENNLVHDAVDMGVRGITAQAANYGLGDPEDTIINFNVKNNTVANVSNSGGGAIVTDTDATSVAGDTVNAVIFNNVLEGNAYGIGTITAGGSDETVTMYNDYNLVHTDIIAPASDNYFGTMSTGDVAAGAHDVSSAANFVGSGDYSLALGSPALNVGAATFHSVNAPSMDIQGTSRPQGSAYDLGAFEKVVNTSPTANAGADQYTSINETNTLDCSGSTDPEDDTLTYNWVKTAGDSVTGFTSGTGTATRTFTPTSLGDYTFVCAVNDGVNPTATDTVVVHATAKRIAGASDRYDTAVKISQTQFPTAHTINRLVIASGENYPDALAAGPLAAVIGGPILLTQKNTLPSQTNTEITRVLKTSDANGSTTDIYVIGGTAAISDAVLNSIKGLHPGFEVKRIAGATDRVDTAIAISKEMDALRGNPISFAIASGYNSMDAAAIAVPMADTGIQVGSTSNWRRSAVLLTNTSNLDSRVSAYLNSKKSGVVAMYIAGSTSNVSASAQTALNTIFGASKVTRVSATDHYDLPPMIASQFYSTPSKVGVTTGENFPDVLAAGPLAASLHMPLFYSDNVVVNDSISYYMDHHLATLDSVYVFGGTAAISNNTKGTFQTHL